MRQKGTVAPHISNFCFMRCVSLHKRIYALKITAQTVILRLYGVAFMQRNMTNTI